SKQYAAMFSWRKEQEKIAISVEADDYLVSVYVEGIQQVISNLLENAMQYDAGSEAIKVRGEQRDSFYYVAVSGQSEFIPEKEAGNLFKRFYRLDQSRNRVTGGNGLGLAIAKEIVENHGGRIGVKSGGSYNTFWFELPL